MISFIIISNITSHFFIFSAIYATILSFKLTLAAIFHVFVRFFLLLQLKMTISGVGVRSVGLTDKLCLLSSLLCSYKSL